MKKLSEKGDVERKILWTIVLLILLVVVLAAFYNLIINTITKLFMGQIG